jgi:hypothetical protein
MMRRLRISFLAVLAVLVLVVYPAVAGSGKKVKGPLDRAVIHVETISSDAPVRIRTFPTENADLGTGAKKDKPKYQQIADWMQENAPGLLVEGFLGELEANGFSDAAELSGDEELPEDCLVVEGEFTKLNPGSQGKRYWVGFGAGKSKICIEGKIVSSSGEVVAEFEHCRAGAMGWFGGSSTKQMHTDVTRTGVRLASFMTEWSTGKFERKSKR